MKIQTAACYFEFYENLWDIQSSFHSDATEKAMEEICNERDVSSDS